MKYYRSGNAIMEVDDGNHRYWISTGKEQLWDRYIGDPWKTQYQEEWEEITEKEAYGGNE